MIAAPLPQIPYRRILMTGGTGFVGRYLAPLICEAAPDARRMMVSRSQPHNEIVGWSCITAEIQNSDEVDPIFESFRPDLVIHMAAQASVGAASYSTKETWNTNFGGSFTVASAVTKYCPEAVLLFPSSAEVYGLSFNAGQVDETAPLQPLNCYARSKVAAEYVIGDVLPASFRLIIARPFNHLGVGQDERFVISSFVNQIVRIEAGLQPPKILVGNLESRRDFLDVRDVCQAYIGLLAHAKTVAGRQVFNICSGTATRISDILEILRSHAKCPFDVVVDPARLRPNEIPVAVGDARKLNALTGWEPRNDVAETITALLQATRASFRISQPI